MTGKQKPVRNELIAWRTTYLRWLLIVTGIKRFRSSQIVSSVRHRTCLGRSIRQLPTVDVIIVALGTSRREHLATCGLERMFPLTMTMDKMTIGKLALCCLATVMAAPNVVLAEGRGRSSDASGLYQRRSAPAPQNYGSSTQRYNVRRPDQNTIAIVPRGGPRAGNPTTYIQTR
jgi:hypothetical protein